MHSRDCLSRAIESSYEDDIYDPAPVFDCNLCQETVPWKPGIIHEYVWAAPTLAYLPDSPGNRCKVDHVCDHPHRAFLAEFINGLRDRMLIEIENDNTSALAVQGSSGDPADSTRSAGNQRDFSFEAKVHFLIPAAS